MRPRSDQPINETHANRSENQPGDQPEDIERQAENDGIHAIPQRDRKTHGDEWRERQNHRRNGKPAHVRAPPGDVSCELRKINGPNRHGCRLNQRRSGRRADSRGLIIYQAIAHRYAGIGVARGKGWMNFLGSSNGRARQRADENSVDPRPDENRGCPTGARGDLAPKFPRAGSE